MSPETYQILSGLEQIPHFDLSMFWRDIYITTHDTIRYDHTIRQKTIYIRDSEDISLALCNCQCENLQFTASLYSNTPDITERQKATSSSLLLV